LRLYEGMFILNETRCTEDYNGTVEHVHDILKEFGADIVDSRKWDDRRLAYPIGGQSRGIFVLVHFNAEPRSIAAMERRLHMASDIVLRDLITVDEDGVNMGREREREAQREAQREAEREADAKPNRRLAHPAKRREMMLPKRLRKRSSKNSLKPAKRPRRKSSQNSSRKNSS